MRFTEMKGWKPVRDKVQIDSMDERLKNGIWNIIYMYVIEPMRNDLQINYSDYKILIGSIWGDFLGKQLQTIPLYTYDIEKRLNDLFNSWHYGRIYYFVEYLASFDLPNNDKIAFNKKMNSVLEREYSGYRLVNEVITPITSELEISEVENAISDSSDKGFMGVNTHLSEALKMLSDRENPDYRNSIKESISAVESICKQIVGEEKATLGKALNKLKTQISLHPTLEQAYSKIYGWTSNAGGMRHAITNEETIIDQEEARYMLVSCSAFVNYLIVKADKAGIEIQ